MLVLVGPLFESFPGTPIGDITIGNLSNHW